MRASRTSPATSTCPAGSSVSAVQDDRRWVSAVRIVEAGRDVVVNRVGETIKAGQDGLTGVVVGPGQLERAPADLGKPATAAYYAFYGSVWLSCRSVLLSVSNLEHLRGRQKSTRQASRVGTKFIVPIAASAMDLTPGAPLARIWRGR